MKIVLEKQEVIKGKCGDNATYVLDGDTLTISGTGSIEEKDSYKLPKASKVIIEDGITEIGKDAFSFFKRLTNITIPDSVTIIGYGAFAYCWELKSITIPESVTSIGDYAFICCNKLTSMNIPDGVISIGVGTFFDCDSLKAVTIPSSVTSIGKDAFAQCSNLSSVEIKNPSIKIGAAAFSGCKLLPKGFLNTYNRPEAKAKNRYPFNLNDDVDVYEENGEWFDSDLYAPAIEIVSNKLKVSDLESIPSIQGRRGSDDFTWTRDGHSYEASLDYEDEVNEMLNAVYNNPTSPQKALNQFAKWLLSEIKKNAKQVDE